MEELKIKFVFGYDDETHVWIGEGKEKYEGIILEADSIEALAKRIEEAIKDWEYTGA